jgi:hypothetical protein
MATSNQKRLSMNRFNWNSAVGLLSKSKMRSILGRLRLKIFDPGASWRRFFCAISSMKAVIAIFLFATLNRGVRGSSRGLSQSLTKSPAFLLF